MANPIERVTQLTRGVKHGKTLLKEHPYTHAQIWVQIWVSIRICHIPLHIYSLKKPK